MPSLSKKILIVGGDGLIGASLANRLTIAGVDVKATSRRNSFQTNLIPFDFLNADTRSLYAIKPDIAVICAAMTNMQACENDPIASHRINVIETVRLINGLITQGTFVVFLSSNTVFDGQTPWPSETATPAPTSVYGRQKSDTEKQLLAHPDANRHLSIVRLSKVISGKSGLAQQFTVKLRAQEHCRAFSDILLSPISLSHVTNHLAAIALSRQPGIFHLSGAVEISYADFAQSIADHIGAKRDLVQAIDSTKAGVEVLFKPRHPGLGMTYTTERLGYIPEQLDSVLASLFSSAN